MSRSKKIIIAALISISLLLAAILFYTFNPGEVMIFPHCPFLLATGFECPGCGSQRAIHSMLHFNFTDAFHYNALILFLVPYILLGFYLEVMNGKKHFPRLEKMLFGKWAAIIVITGIFIYWIVRNL